MSAFRPFILLALWFLVPVLASHADTVRLIAWDMEAGGAWADTPDAALSNSNSVARSAAVLRELNPDIIILHKAPHWKACQQLAAALEPAKYSVQVCSAFPGSGKQPGAGRQVAILAKQKAYFSWYEAWETPARSGQGGFAFAAIQAGAQRLGIFVVQVETTGDWGPTSPESLQWASAVGGFKRWATNKLDAAVVAFRARDVSQAPAVEAGLARTFTKNLALPFGPVNSFSATLPADPVTLPVLLSGQTPLICDLDVAPANLLQAQGRRVDTSLTLLQRVPFLSDPLFIWSAIAAAAIAIMVLLWAVTALRRRVRKLAAPPAVALLANGDAVTYSDTFVVAPGSATATSMQGPLLLENLPAVPVVNIESGAPTCTQSQALGFADASARSTQGPLPESVKAGVIDNLTQWLKKAFLRRVLADRELLMQGQAHAGDKTAAMDARLADIEMQIQQQTRIYEQRIQDLTRELEASRQENRALILAKIAQVKSEMAATRARIARS